MSVCVGFRALATGKGSVQRVVRVVCQPGTLAFTRCVPDTEPIVVLVDHQLRAAIAQKRLIEFTYQRMWRVAEPHDYGLQHGVVRLLVYQVRSRPFQRGWRMLDVAKIEQLKVLEKEFRGTRREGHTHHFQWDTVFARVE